MDTNEEASEAKADLQERLRLAQQKREQARLKREELESEGELERRVEAEEQAAIDEEALLAAEAKHGRHKIATVDTPMGLIVLKRPGTLHFKRFQDKESAKTVDLEMLVRPCLVHPTKARFAEILEELPATLTRCADRVAVLAGVRVREVTGK